MLLMTLMRDKYPLHVINEIVSMVGPLKDLLYNYEYRKINTSDMNDSYNCFRWKSMTVYHAYYTFNLGDRIGSNI
jgi:hypothetical protein